MPKTQGLGTGHRVEPIFTHSLDLEGAAKLYVFLNSISLIKDSSRSTSGHFVEIEVGVPSAVLEALRAHPELVQDPGLVRAILQMNPELCKALLETEIEAFDVTSLAYRKRQLKLMQGLLEDDDLFVEHKASLGVRGDEAVWQRFFEANQWIFGLGLNYMIGEGVQAEKLEQVVAGASIAATGKRADALLQSRGALHSLCYVEIKTHTTPLLSAAEYRPEVWKPHEELSGAVAQSQKTVQLALEHFGSMVELPTDSLGADRRQFLNYAPRSIVVCGSLRSFVEEEGIDYRRFSSFELYRRNLSSPDIVTFDELYDRACAIVGAGLAEETKGASKSR